MFLGVFLINFPFTITNTKIRILVYKICQDFLWSIWTILKEAQGDDFGTYGIDRYNRGKKNLELLDKILMGQ